MKKFVYAFLTGVLVAASYDAGRVVGSKLVDKIKEIVEDD